MRSGIVLLCAAVLAGCNSQPPEPTVLENEAQIAATAATMRGWDRVFNVPTETIGRANQFGFRAPAYAADGPTFLSEGAPITLSQSDADKPNTGTFEAAGTTAQAIERVAFTLRITDPANADTAKQRFTDMIKAFLSQYDLQDDEALAAIASETASDATVAGQPSSIAVAKGDGDTRTITVTFTRPATITPDIQPAQGQADGNRA
ncbi:hypothetical protein OKW76_09055 [Sphingomonas sp. S1-29]|uniref:hypothetical protein n=1 Tax=Sphingomonas sp. S1-29 TaxID=2991074 RepID=UPI00223F7EDA|nr:hypothetical protein [Sphingomonas sp. S1-29]UZK68222.1 hypothetical protein OKW76_09055 [Sphingomonas sp. S1-29]